jgi:hypothetical protein
MTASTINKRQLTIDTSCEIDDEYEPRQLVPPPPPPPMAPRIVPTYCSRRDNLLKHTIISMLAMLNIISLLLVWHFNPSRFTINIIHQVAVFICYAFVITTTDLDEFLNKHTTNEKILVCRFIGNCDWIMTFIEIAEGLIRCLDHFITYGELLSPYLFYTSIGKFILYVYLLRNV